MLGGTELPSACRFKSMVAAATENDYDSKNYDPGAVVVKNVAKTVIHTIPPKDAFAAFSAVQ